MLGSILKPRLILGLLIMLLGILLTLDNLGLFDFEQVLEHWPLLLVFIGVAKLFSERPSAGFFWIVGGLFFLIPRYFEEVDVEDLWPMLLVLLGISLVLRSFARPRKRRRRRFKRWMDAAGVGDDGVDDDLVDDDEPSFEDSVNIFAVLSSSKRQIQSHAFRGGDVVAVMGGCELDLREVELADDEAVLDVVAMWGGIDVRVPESWNVSMGVTPIMGGAEDSRSKKEPARAKVPAGEPSLVIRGIVIMGGIDVRR